LESDVNNYDLPLDNFYKRNVRVHSTEKVNRNIPRNSSQNSSHTHKTCRSL